MAKDDSILPTAGKYLTNNLKTQYYEAISQIIADMGREVILHLPPTVSGCPNCKNLSIGDRSLNVYNISNPFGPGPYNQSFPNGRRCPVCASTHEIKTHKSVQWRATINKNLNRNDYNIEGVEPQNVVLTKMLIEAWNDIENCIRATIDGVDYVKLSETAKIGMGNLDTDLKFVNILWKKVK